MSLPVAVVALTLTTGLWAGPTALGATLAVVALAPAVSVALAMGLPRLVAERR